MSRYTLNVYSTFQTFVLVFSIIEVIRISFLTETDRLHNSRGYLCRSCEGQPPAAAGCPTYQNQHPIVVRTFSLYL